jgi:hypothetical protein
VVLPWFTFLFTLFAAVMLFITSSRVDNHLEQAYEETYGVQIKKASVIDRDADIKEGTGPQRSLMPVSEKSPGAGSTVDSPESRRSYSIADHSSPTT